MWKKVLICVVILAVLVGGFIVITNNNETEQIAANAKLVKTIEAKEETLITEAKAEGSVQPLEKNDIKMKLNGIIADVYVEEGDQITVGQKILKLEDEDIQNNLESAKLSYEEAKGNYQSLRTKYRNQEELNVLKFKEAERKLTIARLSYQEKKNNLNDQKKKLEDKVKQAEENLADAEEEYEYQQHLYKIDAVAQKTLKDTETTYVQARRNYINLKNDLEVLMEKTIPNSLELKKLEIENAESQLNNIKLSIENEQITKHDLEIAVLRADKAENQLNKLKADFKKTNVLAPINGTIVKLDVISGDRVGEGTTAAQIANLKQFVVEAWVDEIDVNEIEVGQEVKITSDSFEKELKGVVQHITPAGSERGNLIKYKTKIKVSEDEGLLKPGMFVTTDIITNKKENIISVPQLAIQRQDDKSYVFIVDDGKAVKRSVELGLKTISKIEITGVEAEEKVIVGPFTVLQNLEEGTAVKEAGGETDLSKGDN